MSTQRLRDPTTRERTSNRQFTVHDAPLIFSPDNTEPFPRTFADKWRSGE